MTTIKRFEDLKIGPEARKLCQSLYKRILANDSIKDYSLKNQTNSSRGSVTDKIQNRRSPLWKPGT